MHIPNVDTQNCPFCKLNLVVETFGHSTKGTNQSTFNKSSQIKKTLLFEFGTSVINSPMSPSSLENCTFVLLKKMNLKHIYVCKQKLLYLFFPTKAL